MRDSDETTDSKSGALAEGDVDAPDDDGDPWSEAEEPGSSKWVSRRQRDPEKSEERRLSERRDHPRRRQRQRDRSDDD